MDGWMDVWIDGWTNGQTYRDRVFICDLFVSRDDPLMS